MIGSKLLKRFKAAATCAAVAVTALAAPMSAENDHADAAYNVNYAKALQYSLYLYDANMCGSEVGETSQFSWRDDCHTYDSSVSTPYGTMDLSGGFHDAGDHVKFGLPAAYSATMLGWGYYEFKDAYTRTGQASHLQTITDYFCDYFKRCTVMNGSSVQAFCYQVGDGDTDHAIWESPENQTIARPAYFATASNPCTDVVAETAAALAMNYINFKNSEDLTYAKALYEFAKNNNKANHQFQSYYQGTSYLDDLALASVILYKATNNSSYKSDCADYISQSNWAYTTNYPLCWDSVWPAVNAIYANEWDRVAANVNELKNGYNTSQGYACRDNWGSARYNTAQQLVGLVYDKYNNTSTYKTWANSQMEYLFGGNNSGNCYMVGYSNNSVSHPHHRASSGLNTYLKENDSREHKYILAGALVGGPDQSDNFSDYTDAYKYTEVALDYNAAFVGALAGLYLEYGSGQSVDSVVPGTESTVNPTTTAPVTTVTTSATTILTTTEATTTTTVSTSVVPDPTSGTKVVDVNKKLDYSSDTENILQIKISDLLPSGAKAEKFIVKLSASGNIGSPSISGGINVTNNDDYWLDLDGTQKISGSTGTIEFDVKSIQDYIQENGVFQIGYWWGEQNTVNIESVTCIYTDDSAVVTTAVTTKATTTSTATTTETATVETTITTTTTIPSSSDKTVTVNKLLDYTSDTEKILQVEISDLLPSGSKAEKFIVKISASGNIGTPSIGGGISVTNNNDNWLDLNGKQSVSGSSGTIEFDVKSVQDYIQEDGVFQIGYWWGEQNKLTVDSITCVYSSTQSAVTSVTTMPVTTSVSTQEKPDTTVPSVSPTIYGDVNVDGFINVSDVVALNMYILSSGENKLSDVGIANADCVKDGVINTSDSLLIMNYVAMIVGESQLGK